MLWRLGLGTSDGPPQSISVSVPDVAVAPASMVEIPVTVGSLTGRGILSFQFTLTYNDPDSILSFGERIDTAGTLMASNEWWGGLVNTSVPNQIAVGGYRASSASGEGVLLKLRARVSPTALPGQTTKLTLSSSPRRIPVHAAVAHSQEGGQMAARRETPNADALGIDAVIFAMSPDGADGPLGVGEGRP